MPLNDFVLLQVQLLELREQNYQLTDSCRRHEKEISQLRDHSSKLEKDLNKANTVISKSKKAKEVEVLVQDSESLQSKLISQEEDFRLQNETLMAELGKVCSTRSSSVLRNS